jgi:hypothetical protein
VKTLQVKENQVLRNGIVLAMYEVHKTLGGVVMKTYTFFGGVLGLIIFLTVGLLPAIVYGGFAGVTLAGAILGTPIGTSILAKALVVFGMVTGLLGTASIFVVLGAIFGTGVGSCVEYLRQHSLFSRSP